MCQGRFLTFGTVGHMLVAKHTTVRSMDKRDQPTRWITCEKCLNPNAIIAYESLGERHCMCPRCDHVWSVAQESTPPATNPPPPEPHD